MRTETRIALLSFAASLAAVTFMFVVAGAVFAPRRAPAPAAPPGPARELSDAEFTAVADELTAVVVSRDPAAALGELRMRTFADPSVARSCHTLAHVIGRAAFDKYGDFGKAMTFMDEICNSGYVHGVIERYFEGVKDPFTAVKTTCQPYPAGGFMRWECAHGIGHGLMDFTENDLPRSIALCGTLGADDRRACVNGVFMENFNTDQDLHPTSYLRDDDLFYPCDVQDAADGAECYFYAPVRYLGLHHDDYAGALVWCASLSGDSRDVCLQGVGSEAMKRNLDRPAFVEGVCEAAAEDARLSCVTGMAQQFVNVNGATAPAHAMCAGLAPWASGVCERTVAGDEGMFAKDAPAK